MFFAEEEKILNGSIYFWKEISSVLHLKALFLITLCNTASENKKIKKKPVMQHIFIVAYLEMT